MKQSIIRPNDYYQAFLGHPNIHPMLDANTRAMLDAGTIKLEDSNIYVRKNIEDETGRQSIFVSTLDEEQGITNIDKRRLPENEHFVATHVAVRTGSGDGVTDPAKIANWSNVRSSVPQAVAGGRLILSQENKTVFDLQIFQMLVAAASTEKLGLVDGLELIFPRLIQAAKIIDLDIEYAKDETVDGGGTVNTHLEIVISGVRTIPK